MKVPEIDLHGLDREEAIAEVDREVNHAFIQDEDGRRMKFITGWGGVLRPLVTEYLKKHPLVREISVDGPAIRITLEDL